MLQHPLNQVPADKADNRNPKPDNGEATPPTSGNNETRNVELKPMLEDKRVDENNTLPVTPEDLLEPLP